MPTTSFAPLVAWVVFNVPSDVFRLAWKHKDVFGIVVSLVSVDVMHDLTGFKWTAKNAFRDNAVFMPTIQFRVGFSVSAV